MAAARAILALLLALQAELGSALLVGVHGASGFPGLDELEEPLEEELLAMESLRGWTLAPSYEVRRGGVVGVVPPINRTSSGLIALNGCSACQGVQGTSALPGLDELEEPLDEELLAEEPRSRAGALSRPRPGPGELEGTLAEELLASLRSWTAVPFQLVRARQ